MKTQLVALTTIFLFFVSVNDVKAQLTLDGDFRFRPEYRHGFQSLPEKDQAPVFINTQRSRLNVNYKEDRYAFRFSIQDVRTWGSQSQANVSDGLLSIHEAWVEYNFNRRLSLKGGRMELAYDNHRILGNLDWAQQGRKHDVALVKFVDSTWALHAGFAYNQDKDQSVTNLYTVPNNYKTMQFAWFNKQFSKLNLSLLFLNNGTQYTQTDGNNVVLDHKIKFSQTTGFNAEFKSGRVFLNGFAYMQTGRDSKDRRMEAIDVSLEAGAKVADKTTVSIGSEYLSGTANRNNGGVNYSFSPLYGTNHAFNGYMDYFYVGNHANNVGLHDMYLKVKQNVGKGILSLNVHEFKSAATLVNIETGRTLDSRLGTEVDLTYRLPVSALLTVQAGYSHMIATSSMEYLKKGSHSATSNWAYIWIIFKPQFLKKSVAQ